MTTDLLLSVSDLFLTMGLPSIDESLDKLLVAMESFPKSAILGDTVGYARVLGLLLALCVGSYECWMMMLGRRAMDVMKLARIIALSMCITSSSWICSELQVPGKALENTTKAMAKAKNKQVAAMELKVAQKQADYRGDHCQLERAEKDEYIGVHFGYLPGVVRDRGSGYKEFPYVFEGEVVIIVGQRVIGYEYQRHYHEEKGPDRIRREEPFLHFFGHSPSSLSSISSSSSNSLENEE